MALKFKNNWNKEKTGYADKYGSYKAFLETLTENGIRKAFSSVKANLNDRWIDKAISDALGNGSPNLTIEQGTHQIEDLEGGGFCLHFTGRDADKFALHFYIVQDKFGLPLIFEITYVERGKVYNENLNTMYKRVSK